MSEENKQFWRFENSASGDTNEATLYVYGDIVTYDMGNWNWPDDVVPNKFKNELKALGDVSKIHVRINSNGGSVFAAYAIMNLLKTHKAEVITYNDGIAASAATIIAMAGDKVVTALGSVWMVHLPATIVFGNANDFKKAVEVLNTITESMIDIYNHKTGIERNELEKMLNEDTWLTGTQALQKGFADEVTDLQVVAYLNEDKKTAFFNGLNINLDKAQNIAALEKIIGKPPATLPKSPPAQEAQATNQPECKGKQPSASGPQNQFEEGKIMNLEDLKAKHPEIYNAIFALGAEQGEVQGAQNERTRIKEIIDMALPGMEDLTNKALFETGITAGVFAVELIRAQKEKGVSFLNDAKKDAEHLNDVGAAGAPQNSDDEENALLAHLDQTAKK